MVVGSSRPVGVEEEIPLCSSGVSDRRVASPGAVFTSDGRIRKQPCGRYDSNPSCLCLALRHGPLQHFRSPKVRATPLRNVRNISTVSRLLSMMQPRGVQLTSWRRWAYVWVWVLMMATINQIDSDLLDGSGHCYFSRLVPGLYGNEILSFSFFKFFPLMCTKPFFNVE